MEWLPYYDPDFDVLHCNHDEELAIRSWSLELPPSWSLAKYAAPTGSAADILKDCKVSVGVSVSGGLLDLNISTDDISSQELLDI